MDQANNRENSSLHDLQVARVYRALPPPPRSDDGPQAQARALLSPAIGAAAADVGSAARIDDRASAPDAVQLAQRFTWGTTDVHADRQVSSAASPGASERLRLAERRHDGGVHELIQRTILDLAFAKNLAALIPLIGQALN